MKKKSDLIIGGFFLGVAFIPPYDFTSLILSFLGLYLCVSAWRDYS